MFGAMDLHATLVEEARGHGSLEIIVAAAILTRRDGTEAVVQYVAEYGDGDGTERVQDLIREIRSYRLLTPGERLEYRLLRVPLRRLQ